MIIKLLGFYSSFVLTLSIGLALLAEKDNKQRLRIVCTFFPILFFVLYAFLSIV